MNENELWRSVCAEKSEFERQKRLVTINKMQNFVRLNNEQGFLIPNTSSYFFYVLSCDVDFSVQISLIKLLDINSVARASFSFNIFSYRVLNLQQITSTWKKINNALR